ncbi:MAG: hypothetical protein HZB16_19670 [Armatimonadetes bacterium]|nr:hypothetical protein [Armatimonadota bacterium]
MSETRQRGQRQSFGPDQGIWLRLGLAVSLWWPLSVVLLSQWGQWPGFGQPGAELDRFGFFIDRFIARGAGIVLAVMVGLVSVLRVATTGDRVRTLRAAVVPVLAVAAWLAVVPLVNWCDTRAEWRLVRRSAPLVAVLDQYTADHGHVPPTLTVLVPAYLPAVPHTGWPACPEYDYRAYGERVTWRSADGRPWVAQFTTPASTETYHGPGPNNGMTRAQITARLGQPSTVESLSSWRLGVHLRDSLLDEHWLEARHPARGTRSIFGRWGYGRS